MFVSCSLKIKFKDWAIETIKIVFLVWHGLLEIFLLFYFYYFQYLLFITLCILSCWIGLCCDVDIFFKCCHKPRSFHLWIVKVESHNIVMVCLHDIHVYVHRIQKLTHQYHTTETWKLTHHILLLCHNIQRAVAWTTHVPRG